MLPIKHILFPLDFSERCCGAVPFVESTARRFGARITLLSVAQPIYYGAGDPAGPVATNADEMMEDLKQRLGMSLTREFAGLEVERVAEMGDPATVITEFAKTNGVDVIMMPTHGYGPFRSLLLGSVTAKVLHDSECAVWTAAHAGEQPCRRHVESRNLLCAIDGTPKSVPVMQLAARYAAEFGATLRFVHVVAPGSEEQIRRDARERIAHLQISAGVNAPLCVTTGDVSEGVREEARRHGADLVMIGRGILHEALGRLRTHAHGIIRHSPCPVLSV